MKLLWLTMLIGAVAAGTTPASAAGLTMNIYSNSAMNGSPKQTQSDVGFPLNIPYSDTSSMSVEVLGTLTFDKPAFYSFACTFTAGQIVFVWIDDHLVCHTNPPFTNTPSSVDGIPQNPIPFEQGVTVPVIIHGYRVNSTSDASVNVEWAHQETPVDQGVTPPISAIPHSLLSGSLPDPERSRRDLQNSLKVGWSSWTYNMLGIVRLPDSSVVTTAICKLSTQQCLNATHIEDSAASIRVGVFATDSSYWQFYLGYQGINVSLSISGGTNALNFIAEPVDCINVNCSDYALVILPRFAWFRGGEVDVDSDEGSVTLTPSGMNSRKIYLTSHATSIPLPLSIITIPHLVSTFSNGSVGAVESSKPPQGVGAINATISAMRQKEYDSYRKFGEFADVKEAVQAATMWNYIYTPSEYGPFLPVSRQWDFVKHPDNLDWAYVIFDWDNIFASYITSLSSKDIAYSNFIQVIKSRTATGQVPNYEAGGSKSIDRTEPPIGAKVLLEMYNKFKDIWIVEYLFDDLMKWNDFFVYERAFGPLGLISLGSDTFSGFHDYAAGSMQAARFESGLDNSPMYDGNFFNNNVSHNGSWSIGQMELYDVGFSSMFVQEADALATLATLLNRSGDATKMSTRAANMRSLISKHLWDDAGGIFTNLFWNETFYRRISPTSFYSMMSLAPTDEQAAAMVDNWLLSPEHFCIAPNGDFDGNHDDCYWGLPSIQRNDSAYPPLGYWRGYVWGPMAQLTYWSLQYYDHVEAVRNGRKSLCKQMTALMRSQWNEHRHICENYNPHKTADTSHGDCSGTKFYHWGSLTGMISLVEEGYYY